MRLSELSLGESAVIDLLTDAQMSIKLIEMGCIPGEAVRIEQIAPMGCPIAITVAGYKLSMRRQEAATIILK